MGQKSKTKNREILIASRAILISFCETQGKSFISTASEYLLEKSERTKIDSDSQQLSEARQTLENPKGLLLKKLDHEIKARFKVTFPTSQSNPKPLCSTNISDDLRLIDEFQMEIMVAVNGMAHRASSDCASQLLGLTKRISTVNRGVDAGENSPYAPSVFCGGFVKFLESQTSDQTIKLLLLKLFERFFMANLGDLYDELNQLFISANVLPKLSYKNHNPTKPLLTSSDLRQSDLYESIETAIGNSVIPIDPSKPTLTIDQVLAELNALQQHQNTLSGATLTTPAVAALPNTNSLPLQQIIDAVATLFDMVNTEELIASPIKTLLSHLETPYAKIAIQDPNFLKNPHHEARRLFNSLIDASGQWTDKKTDFSNEIVQRISVIVERITRECNGDPSDDLTLFDELLKDFSVYLEALERKANLTEQRSVQAAKGREKLKENQLFVKQVVDSKTQFEFLPSPIAKLIRDDWSSYMTYILLRYGEQSAEWDQAGATVDTLLWYIEPKTDDTEAKLAREIRTPLREILQHGMKSIGLDAVEIKGKLAALDLCQSLATENSMAWREKRHADESNIINNKNPIDNAGNAINERSYQLLNKPEEKIKSCIEKQSETPLKEASAQTELSGEHSENLISINLQKDLQQAPEIEIEKVLSMRFGTWLSWSDDEAEPQELKLTWYNARTQNCMLSDHHGKEVAVVAANVIALGMMSGAIYAIDEQQKKPLFERMLEKISGQLKQSESKSAANQHGIHH